MEKKLYKKHKYYSILSLDAWFNGNNRGKTGIYMAFLIMIIGGAVSGIMEKLIGFETNYMAFVLFFIWIIVRGTIKSNSKLILSIHCEICYNWINMCGYNRHMYNNGYR